MFKNRSRLFLLYNNGVFFAEALCDVRSYTLQSVWITLFDRVDPGSQMTREKPQTAWAETSGNKYTREEEGGGKPSAL